MNCRWCGKPVIQAELDGVRAHKKCSLERNRERNREYRRKHPVVVEKKPTLEQLYGKPFLTEDEWYNSPSYKRYVEYKNINKHEAP